MSKISREVLLERTTEAEVFQDMDNFDLLNDSSIFALSLRLQFPKFSKGFSSSDFEPFVRTHVGEGNLVSLGRLSFPNEWQMQVANKDIRESLIRLGRTKINTRTCWITPLSQSEVRGFIHWIPNAVSNNKLETLLRDYGEVLLMENQKNIKWTCKVESDARYFGLYLKSGKTMEDVPHFIKVSDYPGLITIRGRNPACFHCKEIGHRKSECKKFREKISDYSMRPPHSGNPRVKPRGRRHNPKKDAGPKAIDQGIQAGEGIITCVECLKEQEAARLAAEASEQQASAAKESEQQVFAAEESEQQVSAAEAIEHQVSAVEETEASTIGTSETEVLMDSISNLVKNEETLASLPFVPVPEFQSIIMKKTKKQLAQEKFNAQLEAASQHPVLNVAQMLEELTVQKKKTKPDSNETISITPISAANLPEQGAVPQKTDCAELGSLSQLEQLQRSMEEILTRAREASDPELEASKQRLLIQEAEKSAVANAEGKKKKKKRKKKKTEVEVELCPSTVPKDIL